MGGFEDGEFNSDIFNAVWDHFQGQKVIFKKITILTLKHDLLTLKVTPDGVENVTIELAVLKTPHLDPENMFLALLEVILAQDPGESLGPKLEHPSRGRSSPYLKESMAGAYTV